MKHNLLLIEKIEKDILLRLGWIFKNSLKDFSTSIDKSLGYLDKITLPIIMASKKAKSYNPFSEIIEKFTLHILTCKFEKEGYKLLPLSYSADLVLENNNHILSIDIKTANTENLSDFKGTVAIGINQMTHVAKIRIKGNKFYPSPYFVYPTLPPFYRLPNRNKKLILTYGLLFVYPSYRDLIMEIGRDYHKLFTFFQNKVKNALIPIIMGNLKINKIKAEKFLKSKPERSNYTKEELITESLIRGIFIHNYRDNKFFKKLNISQKESKVFKEFSYKLKSFTVKIRKRNIKPIAILAISIPNGLLKEKYINKFVSGKNYSKSSRYHYGEGIFELIKEKNNEEFPRILFIDVNKKFIKSLKKVFPKINILDYKLKLL